MKGLAATMLKYKLFKIISDNGIFIVTQKRKNGKQYDEEFYPESTEAMEAY